MYTQRNYSKQKDRKAPTTSNTYQTDKATISCQVTAICWHDEKHSRQWQSTKFPFSLEMSCLARTSNLMRKWHQNEMTGAWPAELTTININAPFSYFDLIYRLQSLRGHPHPPAWKAWVPELHSRENMKWGPGSMSKMTCSLAPTHADTWTWE